MIRPIYNMLKRNSKRVSLHMPGHHGKLPFAYKNIIKLDTTELDSTDNLYVAKNEILQAQGLLCQSAKAKNALFLHNGSTAGVQAMIMYAKHFTNKIIIPKNSHLSVYNACMLLNMDIALVEYDQTENNYLYISYEAYINAINNNRDAGALLICTPDYYGIGVNIEEIVKLAHKNKMLVLCDQAHGAHFNWYRGLKNAGEYGADLFVQSAHKTLPAFTASAWILTNNVDFGIVTKCLQSVQSSSPSFLNMLSADDSRAWMDEHGSKSIDIVKNQVKIFGHKIESFGYKLSHDIIKEEIGTSNYIFDETRLVIEALECGFDLKAKLQELSIDVEMADFNRVVCIISLNLNMAKIQLAKLYKALSKININNLKEKRQNSYYMFNTYQAIPYNTAYFSKSEWVNLENLQNRISANLIFAYPPAIPIILWGQTFNDEIIEFIKQNKSILTGIQNNRALCIKYEV